MNATDHDLLQRFQKERCEQAFSDLVSRHAPMVIATARRILRDQHRAEDVAQSVFIDLARKAGKLNRDRSLAGWLYLEARHRSLDFLRSDTRRTIRENSVAMQTEEPHSNTPDLTDDLECVLDELHPAERDVLVLRYLEDRQLADVGRELGISEQAAQKRAGRALDRLRGLFVKRGITIGTGALATVLISQAGATVPITFVASVTSAAVGLATTAVATSTAVSTAMNLFNLKTSAVILSAALITGTTTYVLKDREADRLRADLQARSGSESRSAEEQSRFDDTLKLKDQQIEQLRNDVGDLPRLRGEIDRLNRELESMAKLKVENADLKNRLAATPAPIPAPSTEPDDQAHDLSEFVPRGKWRNAGLATPDDTIMTLQWATLNHDGQAILSASSYPPDLLEGMKQHLTGSGFQNETNPAEAVRILAKIPMGTTKMVVQLEERMYDGTTLKRPVTLVQEADGWKATVTDLGMGTPIGRAVQLPLENP